MLTVVEQVAVCNRYEKGTAEVGFTVAVVPPCTAASGGICNHQICTYLLESAEGLFHNHICETWESGVESLSCAPGWGKHYWEANDGQVDY